MYHILTARNIEMKDAQIKATYEDKAQAIQAFHAEIALACAEHGITEPYYIRYIGYPDMIAADYGSWGDFVAITGVEYADLAI